MGLGGEAQAPASGAVVAGSREAGGDLVFGGSVAWSVAHWPELCGADRLQAHSWHAVGVGVQGVLHSAICPVSSPPHRAGSQGSPGNRMGPLLGKAFRRNWNRKAPVSWVRFDRSVSAAAEWLSNVQVIATTSTTIDKSGHWKISPVSTPKI